LSPTQALLHDRRTINGGVGWDWTFRFSWDEPPAVLVPGRPVRLTVTGTADGPADLQAGAAAAYLRVAGGRATWRTVEGDGAERGFLDRACHVGAYRVGGRVESYAAGRAVYQIDAVPDDGADALAVEIRLEGTEHGVVSYPYERKEVTEAQMHDLLAKPDEARSPHGP
jgi:hypothetical protein